LQKISDGLQGRNDWADMSGVERAAHVGGIAVAAGLGYMLGYSGSHDAQRTTLELMHNVDVPMQHQVANAVGWVVGSLVKFIREFLRDRQIEDDRDEASRCAHGRSNRR